MFFLILLKRYFVTQFKSESFNFYSQCLLTRYALQIKLQCVIVKYRKITRDIKFIEIEQT